MIYDTVAAPCAPHLLLSAVSLQSNQTAPYVSVTVR